MAMCRVLQFQRNLDQSEYDKVHFVAENHKYDWPLCQLPKRFLDWEIDVKSLKLWPQSFREKCIFKAGSMDLCQSQK
jgi:hypothetical protein